MKRIENSRKMEGRKRARGKRLGRDDQEEKDNN